MIHPDEIERRMDAQQAEEEQRAVETEMAIVLNYFDMDERPFDAMLGMAIGQGYVPPTCLLAGSVVMDEMNAARDPCAGCSGPRERCKGRPAKVKP